MNADDQVEETHDNESYWSSSSYDPQDEDNPVVIALNVGTELYSTMSAAGLTMPVGDGTAESRLVSTCT